VEALYASVMRKERISGAVLPQVRDAIEQLATEERRTVSWVVEELLMAALQQRGKLPTDVQQRDLRAGPLSKPARKQRPQAPEKRGR
jgi:hypothetical protein